MLEIDTARYYINEVGVILVVVQAILGQYLPVATASSL
jgi:hypothetical protein